MKDLSRITNRKITVFYDDPSTQPENSSGQQGGGDPKSTFTREEVDALIAKDRNVSKERQRQLEQRLQEMQEKFGQNTALAEELENTRNLLKSKEQLAKEEAVKLQNKAKADLEAAQRDLTRWKALYENSTIQAKVADAANRHGAFNPQQIYAIIKESTRLEPDPDSGNFKVTTEFVDTVEGKPVPVRITVEEAIERMLSKPDYANLFKSTANTGTGRNNGPGGRPTNLSEINNYEDYMANRDQILGRRPRR